MKISKTSRGFNIRQFTDTNDLPCSLQESSYGSEKRVWFGVDGNNKIQILPLTTRAQNTWGFGWQEIDLTERFEDCDILIDDRMHLNQKQVQELLPALEHFAKFGSLPSYD